MKNFLESLFSRARHAAVPVSCNSFAKVLIVALVVGVFGVSDMQAAKAWMTKQYLAAKEKVTGKPQFETIGGTKDDALMAAQKQREIEERSRMLNGPVGSGEKKNSSQYAPTSGHVVVQAASKAGQKISGAAKWTKDGTIAAGNAIKTGIKGGVTTAQNKYFQTFNKAQYKDKAIVKSADFGSMSKRVENLASQLKNAKEGTQRHLELSARIQNIEKQMTEKHLADFIAYKHITPDKMKSEPAVTEAIAMNLKKLEVEMNIQAKELESLQKEKILLNQQIGLLAKKGDSEGAKRVQIERDALREKEKTLKLTYAEIRSSMRNLPENAKKNIETAKLIGEEKKNQEIIVKKIEEFNANSLLAGSPKYRELQLKEENSFKNIENKEATIKQLKNLTSLDVLRDKKLNQELYKKNIVELKKLEKELVEEKKNLNDATAKLNGVLSEKEFTSSLAKLENESAQSKKKQNEIEIAQLESAAAMAFGKDKTAFIEQANLKREDAQSASQKEFTGGIHNPEGKTAQVKKLNEVKLSGTSVSQSAVKLENLPPVSSRSRLVKKPSLSQVVTPLAAAKTEKAEALVKVEEGKIEASKKQIEELERTTALELINLQNLMKDGQIIPGKEKDARVLQETIVANQEKFRNEMIDKVVTEGVTKGLRITGSLSEALVKTKDERRNLENEIQKLEISIKNETNLAETTKLNELYEEKARALLTVDGVIKGLKMQMTK